MHARQQGFIVLQVAVDDRDERRRGRQHAFDAGRAQPPSSDAPDAADARVALAERADVLGGAVGRIVIDKHDLPGDAAQGAVEAADQEIDIVAFVESGHDNAQFRPFLTGQIGRAGRSRLARLARIGDRGHRYSLGERTGVPGACQGRLVRHVARGFGCGPAVRQIA